MEHISETPAGMVHPALGSLAQDRHVPITADPDKGHKDGQSAGTPFL